MVFRGKKSSSEKKRLPALRFFGDDDGTRESKLSRDGRGTAG